MAAVVALAIFCGRVMAGKEYLHELRVSDDGRIVNDLDRLGVIGRVRTDGLVGGLVLCVAGVAARHILDALELLSAERAEPQPVQRAVARSGRRLQRAPRNDDLVVLGEGRNARRAVNRVACARGNAA